MPVTIIKQIAVTLNPNTALWTSDALEVMGWKASGAGSDTIYDAAPDGAIITFGPLFGYTTPDPVTFPDPVPVTSFILDDGTHVTVSNTNPLVLLWSFSKAYVPILAEPCLEIVNVALAHLGQEPVSETVTNSKINRTVNRFWPHSLAAVLEEHFWEFATVRAELVLNATEPIFGYAYAFDLPDDYVRLVDVSPEGLDYVVENGKLLCDVDDDVYIRYIAAQSDCSLFKTWFSAALSARMAADMAMAITGDAAVLKAMQTLYEYYLGMARTRDTSQSPKVKPIVSSWKEAR